MKRNILFIAGVLCAHLSLVAQNLILEDGKRWYFQMTDAVALESRTFIYLLDGDTVVDGRTYFVEKGTSFEDYTTVRPTGQLYREEDGKVYVYNTSFGKEDLLFDLTLQPGESYLYVNRERMDTIKMTLMKIEISQSSKLPAPQRCWTFDADRIIDGECWGGSRAFIFEGIGCSQFGLGPLQYGVVGGSIGISCCYDGENNLIFGRGEEYCYRNTLGIDEVKDEAGGLKVTESAGGRLAFAWNAGAGYRTLSLYSAEGRLVARQRPAAGDTSAAFTGLPRGVYLYYFTAGGQTKAAGKVLVE